MDIVAHIKLLAHYNRWMNEKIFSAAAQLTPDVLAIDKKAYFGSIIGSLNHILITDLIWLKRFAAHPARHQALEPVRLRAQPASLNSIPYPELPVLAGERRLLDALIEEWADELSEMQLTEPLAYQNMKGLQQRKEFGSLVLHFFNHQTHHRGQISTLLSQEGLDIGVTDLVMLIPDEN